MKRGLLLLVMVLFGAGLFGADLKQVLQVPDPLSVGMPFTLTVTAAGASHFGAPIADSLQDFQIVAAKPVAGGLWHRQAKLVITLTAWETGELQLPALKIPVTFGKHTETMLTQPVAVTVTSVLPDSLASVTDTARVAATLKDVAPVAPVRWGVFDYLLPILLLLGILYFILKRQKKLTTPPPVPVTPPPPPEPAWKIALRMLDDLRAHPCFARGDFVEFYFQLSMILRYYIGQRDDFKATEMTTGEIRDAWRTPKHEERDQILRFLKEADRIKFAKAQPTPEQATSAADWVEGYLRAEGRA